MATSAAALYRTGASPTDWKQVWSSPLPTPSSSDFAYGPKDVQFSPDGKQLLVSRCADLHGACVTTLLSIATGAVSRQVTELNGPHPSFSPDGSWIVAADQLLHLPSGEVRSLGVQADPQSPSIFTPGGDIIAGSASGALTLYCRKQ
jgi:Tol biopolymer transport system component